MKIFRLDSRGFTLVEMALVLVIVGILIGLGVGMIGPLTSMGKLKESRETVDASVSSTTSWVAANSRIPNAYTELQTIISKPNDAFSNPLYYFFDTSLAALPSICGRRSTGSTGATSLTLCRTAACAAGQRVTDVAFAIISAGNNNNPQTGIIPCPGGINGICIGVYDSAPSVDNCTTAADCPAANFPATFNRTTQVEEYDDIVRWVTLDELRSKIGCQGAQLKIVNNELPYGSLSSPYSDVYIVGDGGLGSANYQWCIENTAGTAPAGLTYRQNTTGRTALTTIFSSNCSTWPTWGSATQLVVNGKPDAGGSHFFKIFIRDGATAAANTTNKSFVLTINPE